MVNDKIIGILLLIVSIIVIIIYGWLVFFPPQISIMGTTIDIFVLKLTGFIAILALFGILAWIGYTLATTPPPKPIEEIEKEIEQELKKYSQELTDKPRWLVFNKADLLPEEEVAIQVKATLEALNWQAPYFVISAAQRTGTQTLIKAIAKTLEAQKQAEKHAQQEAKKLAQIKQAQLKAAQKNAQETPEPT